MQSMQDSEQDYEFHMCEKLLPKHLNRINCITWNDIKRCSDVRNNEDFLSTCSFQHIYYHVIIVCVKFL